MSSNLAGKTALVTGGARSIGAAIVKRLAFEGAKVAFTYVSNTEAAETFAFSIGPDAVAIKADAADPAAVTAAVEKAADLSVYAGSGRLPKSNQ